MFLLRRRKRFAAPPEVRKGASAGGTTELVRIDFDMLVKGSITRRGRTTIRQYCVTVDGATRLVTSGDTVDRKTWRALVAAGAVRGRTGEDAAADGTAPPQRDAEEAESPLARE